MFQTSAGPKAGTNNKFTPVMGVFKSFIEGIVAEIPSLPQLFKPNFQYTLLLL